MPRVTLYDACNTAYQCDTLSETLLGAWLEEWVPRLAAPDIALRMLVYPLAKGPSHRDGYDWPAHAALLDVPFIIPDEPGKVLAAMQAERTRIEREITRREAHRAGSQM